MKLTLNTPDNRVVDARRFSHYVKNCRFWFAYHRSTDHVACMQVTHIDSGNRVCLIAHNTQCAYLGDDKSAAKRSIDMLIEKHGADRIYSVLIAAEKAANPIVKLETQNES